MSYFNPILNFGLEKFAASCVDSGVDGVIIPDLPVEEADGVVEVSRKYDLSNIFLIAPTSSDERIRFISSLSTHFSYCVSITGVTGAREKLSGDFEAFMMRVRKNSVKPFVVGFGISKHEHVVKVWEWADGAVVGSALLKKISNAKTIDECQNLAVKFIQELKYGAK